MKNNYKLTNDQKAEIVSLYGDGVKTVVIMRTFGLCKSTVTRLVKLAGEKTRRLRKLTQQEIQEVVLAYESGESARTIAHRYGITGQCVLTTLRAQGVPRRSISEGRRVHSINEHAFAQGTPEAAYWIGFLMADGNVYRDRITLVLQERDADHLHRFRDFLGASHPITSLAPGKRKAGMIRGKFVCNRQITVHFQCSSRRLVDTLAAYGVVPNKSKTARVIGLENDRDFWRGLIDGDGCLGLYANDRWPVCPKICLCGSDALVNQFGDYLARQFGLDRPKVAIRDGVSRVQVGGRPAATVVRHLYGDCTVALPRKLAKARQILAINP